MITRHDLGAHMKASYPTAPPTLFGAWRMPPKLLEANQRVWNRTSARAMPAEVLEVDGARLHRLGIVTADGKLVPETVTNNCSGEKIIAESEPLPVIDRDEVCFSFRKPGENNYGHWLIELLTRIALYRHLPEWGRAKVVIARSPHETLDLRIQTLLMAGVQRSDIIIQGDEVLHVGKLFLPTYYCIHSHTHAPWAIEWLREWATPFLRPDRGRRIFVPRPPTAKRQAVNQDEVGRALAGRGFEIASPETLPLPEQIGLFSESRMIVGPIGAALTNLVWSPSAAKVVTFMGTSAKEYFFWDIACHRRQSYTCLVSDPVVPDSGPHGDYRVDLSDLEDALKFVGA
jgi:capsular polysaccharide biosynthesis protein